MSTLVLVMMDGVGKTVMLTLMTVIPTHARMMETVL